MKNLIVILIIISILVYLWITIPDNKELKYDSWKDTIESFGDGTYQVIHHAYYGQNIEILSNVAYNQAVITQLTDYKICDDMAYFIGKYHSLSVYA